MVLILKHHENKIRNRSLCSTSNGPCNTALKTTFLWSTYFLTLSNHLLKTFTPLSANDFLSICLVFKHVRISPFGGKKDPKLNTYLTPYPPYIYCPLQVRAGPNLKD